MKVSVSNKQRLPSEKAFCGLIDVHVAKQYGYRMTKLDEGIANSRLSVSVWFRCSSV